LYQQCFPQKTEKIYCPLIAMKQTKIFKFLAGLGLAAAVQMLDHAQGQTYFTTNAVTGSTYSWEDNNWGITNAAPFTSAWAGDGTAEFYAHSAAYTVTVAAGENMAGLYQAGTNTLTITNSSSSGALNITTTGTPVNFTNAGIQVAEAQQFYLYGNVFIYTPITGVGGIEQRANDALGLYGTNTYSGGTVFTGGQVTDFNNNNSFGTGNLVFNAGGQALVSVATSLVTLSNNVYFQGANYAENFVSSSHGVNFAGNFYLPSTSTNIFEMGGSSGGNVTTISGVISGTNSAVNPNDPGTKEATFNLFGTNTYTAGTLLNTTNILVGFNNSSSFGPGSIFIKNYGINITNAATNTINLPNNIVFGASNNAVGFYGTNITFSGNIALAPTGFNGLTNENNETLTFAGVISGNAELIPEGKGTLVLNNTNTYTGGTYLNNATLAYRYNNGNIFGTGTNYLATSSDIPFEAVGSTPNIIPNAFSILVNNAAINFNSSVGGTGGANVCSGNWYLGTNQLDLRNDGNTLAESVTLSGVISGSGAVQYSANNNVAPISVFGTNTYTGGTYIGNGSTAAPVVTFNNSQSFSTGAVYNQGTNAVTLIATGGSAFTLANNIIMTNAPAGFTFSNANSTSLILAGVISGTGNANFTGAGGTTYLNSQNTYTGTTTIGAGATLELTVSGAISSSSGLILNGGTLDPAGVNQTINPLKLNANSAIDYEAGGAEVDFANSSNLTWNGTLNITNWNSSVVKLRFGTDSSGLTGGQLAQIEFNGTGLGNAQIDANGYIIAGTPSSPITILPPTISGGNINFSFATIANQSYTVWGTTNLVAPDWIEVTNFNGDGNTDQVSFPATNNGAGFFEISTP
jgi:fibronectin-binding autotransporter adhesin